MAKVEPRELHLSWNGVEWVDDRCGCRYHPDDPNGSHGGAPHVHRCKQHAKLADMLPDTRDEARRSNVVTGALKGGGMIVFGSGDDDGQG